MELGKLALQQYNKSKQLSRYKLLAQKLSQHIENFAQDPNTRQRWIWELIQNAKDTPNQFNKVKILVQVNDDSFRFAHNGNPFQSHQLESIINQYSSKVSQNKIDVQTTGKYGTGFITTYIISRKLTISGIHQVKLDPQLVKMKLKAAHDDWSDDDNQSQNTYTTQNNDDIQKLLNYINEPNKQNQKTQEKINPENIPQKYNQQQIIGQKKDFYQKFKIRLDRSYKDRDDQFVKKLMTYQMKIMDVLTKQKIQPVYERTVDDLNTVFSYEKLDHASFQIIRQGIKTIKDMFPYALLFNKKLFQIQVRDNRKKKEFDDFIIKKSANQKINKFNIGVCKIIQNGKQSRLQFAYQTDEETLTTVAIPIQINKQRKKLLKVPNNVPKIYKQFPLIGAEDTPYNYVFTSRNFYPNEKRSNLLLRQIQGRICQKTETNWNILKNVFKIVHLLYKKISQQIKNDVHYYHTKKCDFLGQKNPQFKQYYQQYKFMIKNLQIIQTKDLQYRSSLEIIYIKDQSESTQPKNFSSLCNQIFSFLFNDSEILTKATHSKFYDVVSNGQCEVCIRNIQACLKKISSLGFHGLTNIFKSKEQAFEKMKEIYAFLHKYKPQFVSHRSFPVSIKYQYVLNNELEFVSIDRRDLKVNKDLPKVYIDFMQLFNINIDNSLIHNQLIQYFNRIQSFTIEDALTKIQAYFFQSKQEEISDQKFKTFIKFMKTINVGMNIINEIQIFQCWSRLNPYNISLSGFQPLSIRRREVYQQILLISVYRKIQRLLKHNSTLSGLMSLLKFQKNSNQQMSEQKVIAWLNRLNSYQTSRAYFKYALSWKNNFVQKENLYYIKSYPNDLDIEFYNNMKEKYNKSLFDKKSTKSNPIEKRSQIMNIKDILIHPLFAQQKFLRQTNYHKLFMFTVDLFTNQTDSNKLKFLKYLDFYHKQALEQNNAQAKYKIQVYQSISDKKHIELVRLLKFEISEKTALYNILKRKQVLEDVSHFIQDRNLQQIKGIVELHAQHKGTSLSTIKNIMSRKKALKSIQQLLKKYNDKELMQLAIDKKTE